MAEKVSLRKLVEIVKKNFKKMKEEEYYGGGTDDAEGCLSPGYVNFEDAKREIIESIKKFAQGK